MTEMKAKPAELANFKSTGDTAVTNLTNAQTTYGATVRSFLNTGNSGVSGGYALVGSTITELLGELGEIKDWVELIRVSVLAADAEVHDGTRTVDVNTLNVALKKEAAARGLDVADLVQSNVVTPPVLSVTAVPQDSGFVNDPVCTATGHLLIDAHDFEPLFGQKSRSAEAAGSKPDDHDVGISTHQAVGDGRERCPWLVAISLAISL